MEALDGSLIENCKSDENLVLILIWLVLLAIILLSSICTPGASLRSLGIKHHLFKRLSCELRSWQCVRKTKKYENLTLKITVSELSIKGRPSKIIYQKYLLKVIHQKSFIKTIHQKLSIKRYLSEVI